MHKLFRLILACSLVCIGCACTAFAYSPGEGWQDITPSSATLTVGGTQLVTSQFPYGSFNNLSSNSFFSSNNYPTTSLASVRMPNPIYAFDGNIASGNGVGLYYAPWSAGREAILDYTVSTPYFLYSSGSVGGAIAFDAYCPYSYARVDNITLYFADNTGLDVGSRSTSISSISKGAVKSFSVSVPNTTSFLTVTRITVSYTFVGLSTGDYAPPCTGGLVQFHLANGDLNLDDVPPPEPPQNPEHGGSLSSFTVSVKPTGNYTNLMYYEDIVNGLYNAAIDLEAYSFAEYPYTTVISYSASDGYMYYALICTDHPFISDVQVAMEYVNYGTYDFGFSSTVFMCRVPLNAAANTEYTFYAMSSYSAISAVEFIQNLNNTVKFPSADVSAADFYLSSPICSIMSYESGEPVLYTMCCNYAVGNQDTDGRVYLKQSFKYADSWAYLLLQAGNDGADMSAILQQILDTLRSTDTTVTVYQRLNQIYELMSDTSGLPADSPIVGAIGQSTDTMNAFVSQMEVPDLSEITSFSAQISPVLEDIHNSMGLFAVLAGIGIMLGIIKLVLQR